MKRKGVVKNRKHQAERTKYGERKVLIRFLDGLTEEEYKNQYNNNCKLGVLYALHKYTPNEKLYMKDIVERIGWRIRSVKNALADLRKTGPVSSSIKKIDLVKTKRGSSVFYLNNPEFSELDFEVLKNTYLNVRYSIPPPSLQGNRPEQGLLNICEESYPGSFFFNGNSLGKKIGGYCPDILHFKYPIIIEHFGSIYHQNLEKEKIRLDYLKSKGYYVLIIWDYDENQRNKIKHKIERFVDNAIQNF